MLEIILVWVYIFFTSYAVGGMVMDSLVYRNDRKNSDSRLSYTLLTSLTGLIVIMVIAGYMSLFLKTGLVINVLLCSFSLYYYFIRRKNLPYLKYTVKNNELSLIIRNLFLLIAFILILVKAAGPINNPDTGAYHLPMVKWIENYKVIKGLVNIHSRLGFNYQYELLCAVYGLAFLKGSTIHAMNGYFMLVTVLYLVGTLSFYRTKKLSSLDFIKLVILFFVMNMNNAVSSFSPDFPAAALVIIVLLLVLKKFYDGSLYAFDEIGKLAFLFTIGSVLFKISSAPVFLFCLFFLLPLLKRNYKTVGILFITVILCLLPYFIRNYYTSGYLIYPLYSLDLFDPVWKVNMEQVIFEKDIIRYWALNVPYGQPLPTGKALFATWISYLKISNTAYIYLMGLLGVCVLISIGILVRKLFLRQYDYVWLCLLFYICLGYWWYNAPDPRFGIGFILPFIGIVLTVSAKMLIKNIPSVFTNSTLMVLILLCIMMIKGKAIGEVPNSYDKISYNLLTPPPYIPSKTVNLGTEAKPSWYAISSDTSYCWEACLPCSYQQDKYEYLGDKVEDGFKHVDGEIVVTDSLRKIYFHK